MEFCRYFNYRLLHVYIFAIRLAKIDYVMIDVTNMYIESELLELTV